MIKNNKGISMITLVVTIAVLLILAVIAFGNSTRSIDKAAEEKMIVELKQYRDDLEIFKDTADLLKDEYLIPDVIDRHIKNGDIKVKVLETTSVWYGVTYKEDTEYVKENLKKLHDEGVYKVELWNE